MELTKEQINLMYENAKKYFDEVYPQFLCTVEQDCLVVQLNWQNVTYFNGRGLTRSARTYRCVVKIFKNGNFYMTDVYVDNIDSIGLGGIKISRDSFAGTSWSYHYEKVLGVDNNTGEKGILTYKFCTSEIQKPVKTYFKELGLKKKFYSYSLSIKALPKIGRITAVVVPLLNGSIFSFLGILLNGEQLFFPVFLSLGIIFLLWGIFNIYSLLKKEE